MPGWFRLKKKYAMMVQIWDSRDWPPWTLAGQADSSFQAEAWHNLRALVLWAV